MTIVATHSGVPDAEMGQPFSDEELTALALAADPDAPLDDDAVAIIDDRFSTLPSWYMPAVASTQRGGWRTTVVGLLVVGFLFVAASGFCITYGILQVV